MPNTGSNMAQSAIKKVFSSFDNVANQYRKALDSYLQKNPNVDDSQINTVIDMMGSFRDIAEQLALHPFRVAHTDVELIKNHAKLIGATANRLVGKMADPIVVPEKGDHRFGDEDWSDNMVFDYIKQAYLLNSNALMELVDSLEDSNTHTHDQFMFYSRQIVNALSPSNFPLTNPEVLKKTLSSGGVNLIDGFKQFVDDYKKNPGMFNVSMTDFTAFSVGKNVATTPGKVVFQNEMMQLIQYQPTTEKVNKTPLLIIPPWINKYYILDLKEKNSLIKWLVDQGNTVFIISWVNPGPSYRDTGFEDYMTQGPLAALDAIEKATGESEVNAIGYCVGGTLLASTLAWLTAKRKKRIKSATYLTTLIDFSDPGGIGVFINDNSITNIEKRLDKVGYYDGRAMAFSFNMLRENDLFWSFVIKNYLKGEKPAPFDLLYWNSDGTNLPAKMHGYYLRNMYLENNLVKPGGIELEGVKIDISKIKTPAYFLSTVQDHIAKWKTTYKGALLHSGDVKFVLSGSGHIAGVVNPPAQEKYGYWTNSDLPEESDLWFKAAQKHSGSWWNDWKEWSEQFAGEKVEPRIPGDRELNVIEDAPGSYVKLRIADAIKN
ncbi:PHA/PHB synthase family protein [Alkalimarinus sediminis]|uniref:Class I poly(R)-hydroxyalkanoic acid synthase n=1 Tax=Alkalimarinus sediminis TaxID=1632866 RepID=A0A9E8HJX6_9ALTE|nr:class I poly(R)-hydroxyalkanoic acid synthase [Alkalimarinus sediminis]UZW76048.1 class I poly(R)-hydroxyalkanoic acid synthase [Alkalimarinus sediminis]